MLGYGESALSGRTLREITHPNDLPEIEELFLQLARDSARSGSLDVRHVRRDGALVAVNIVATIMRDLVGMPLYFICMISDMTASLRAQDALRFAQSRTHAILNHIDDFVFVIGFDGALSHVSQGCTKLLGWVPEDLVGRDLFQYIYPEDRDEVKGTIEQFLNSSDKRICLRCRAAHKNGDWVWVDAYAWAVPGPSGPRHEIAGMIRDISENEREKMSFVEEIEQAHARRRAEEEAALTDQLTGLRNRKAADEHLLFRLNGRRAANYPVGCMLVNIDHFEEVREKHGASVADHVIKEVATLVAEACREDDFLARYEDGRFVIVLPSTNPAGTIICGEKVLRKVREADWFLTPVKERITISIGAASMQFRSGLSVPELMKTLTSQLKQAQEGGGDRIVMNKRQATGKSR
jgi:diguanylate cyclase (GGDEF)-like protein/PAS domain S-box-containing protein